MKKQFSGQLLAVLALTLSLAFCAKENPIPQNSAKDQISESPTTATNTSDRDDPEGCNPSPNCWIKVDGLSNEVSIVEQFYLKKDLQFLTWYGVISSWNCNQGNTMQPGIWYPITIHQNTQYQFEFVFKKNCVDLFPYTCKVSLLVGGHLNQFALSTNNPYYFARYNCSIVEGIMW